MESCKRDFKKLGGLSSREVRGSWLFNKYVSNTFNKHMRKEGRQKKTRYHIFQDRKWN